MIPYFKLKRLTKKTFWRGTYLYSLYKGLSQASETNHAILNKLRGTKEVYGIFNANDSKLRNLWDIHFQIDEFYKATDKLRLLA